MSKPIHIGLIMQGGRGWLGGVEYIKNIILALASLPEESRKKFRLSLIVNGDLEPELLDDVKPHLSQIYRIDDYLAPKNLRNRIYWKINRILFNAENPRFVKFLRQQNFDFIFPYWSKTSRGSNFAAAAWIYDFQHKYLPEFFSSDEIQARDAEFKNIAKSASTIVLSSQNAQDDFKKYFPEFAYKTEVLSFKTAVSEIWFEGNPEQIQLLYNLPDRFFVVSNQFWKHKNHLTLFKALSLLQQRSIYPIVVCTGHIYDYRQPSYSDTILQTIHKLGLFPQVFLLGLIPKIDQVQLMRRSLAVLQPSLFEGWSTLVENARCLGKPMILSDLAVNLEQNPPNSTFFNRDSPEELADILALWWAECSPGPDLLQESIAKLENISNIRAFGDRFLEIVHKSLIK
ncbi:MAG: glycosyltransferase family 4 protein [Thermosynechococcaceae cyanobacterium MS004]|nr:glycosyltransferase family 4 protein [Thermosynechococcaceae cyanobacterium MS004]